MPVRVVEDRPDLLAVYPWSRGDDTRWCGHGVLSLHRPGGRHAIWVFWFGAKREFRGGTSTSRSRRRTARGFDTCDQELDVWIRPDGSWKLEDDELLDGWVERGRWNTEEVRAIRAEGARVVADAEAGRQWWSDERAEWTPDPSWTGVDLPPGWDDAS
jgi:hypothetical protein